MVDHAEGCMADESLLTSKCSLHTQSGTGNSLPWLAVNGTRPCIRQQYSYDLCRTMFT